MSLASFSEVHRSIPTLSIVLGFNFWGPCWLQRWWIFQQHIRGPTSYWCNEAAIVFAFEQWVCQITGVASLCLCWSGSATRPLFSAPDCSLLGDCALGEAQQIKQGLRRLNAATGGFVCEAGPTTALAACLRPFCLVSKGCPYYSPFMFPCETVSIVMTSY